MSERISESLKVSWISVTGNLTNEGAPLHGEVKRKRIHGKFHQVSTQHSASASSSSRPV